MKMQHLAVLEEIKTKLEVDDNVLAILVFGSVANNTYHENSDIDLSIVYKTFNSGFEFSTDIVDGIKIGQSKWSYERLSERATISPYRMYVFAHAKMLFDKKNISNIQKDLITYFNSHPEVQKEWDKINENYQLEKMQHGVGQTNIFDVYADLDRKYSD